MASGSPDRTTPPAGRPLRRNPLAWAGLAVLLLLGAVLLAARPVRVGGQGWPAALWVPEDQVQGAALRFHVSPGGPVAPYTWTASSTSVSTDPDGQVTRFEGKWDLRTPETDPVLRLLGKVVPVGSPARSYATTGEVVEAANRRWYRLDPR